MKVAFDAKKWFSGGFPKGSKVTFRGITREILSVINNPDGPTNAKVIVNYVSSSTEHLTGQRHTSGRYISSREFAEDLMVELPDPLQGKAWAQINTVSNVVRFTQFPPDKLAADAIEAGWRNIKIKWEEIPE